MVSECTFRFLLTHFVCTVAPVLFAILLRLCGFIFLCTLTNAVCMFGRSFVCIALYCVVCLDVLGVCLSLLLFQAYLHFYLVVLLARTGAQSVPIGRFSQFQIILVHCRPYKLLLSLTTTLNLNVLIVVNSCFL